MTPRRQSVNWQTHFHFKLTRPTCGKVEWKMLLQSYKKLLMLSSDFQEKENGRLIYAFGTDWEMRRRCVDAGYGIWDTFYVPLTNPVAPTLFLAFLWRRGIDYDNTTPEELSTLPIDWLTVLPETSERRREHGYYFGGPTVRISLYAGRVSIYYITDTNSSVHWCGFLHERPYKQFTTEGIETTASFLKEEAEKKRAEKVSQLLQLGMSPTLAEKFLCARVGWKWERVEILVELLQNSKYVPREVFLRASESSGWHSLIKILGKWGIEDYSAISLPRSQAFFKLAWLLKPYFR